MPVMNSSKCKIMRWLHPRITSVYPHWFNKTVAKQPQHLYISKDPNKTLRNLLSAHGCTIELAWKIQHTLYKAKDLYLQYMYAMNIIYYHFKIHFVCCFFSSWEYFLFFQINNQQATSNKEQNSTDKNTRKLYELYVTQ